MIFNSKNFNLEEKWKDQCKKDLNNPHLDSQTQPLAISASSLSLSPHTYKNTTVCQTT